MERNCYVQPMRAFKGVLIAFAIFFAALIGCFFLTAGICKVLHAEKDFPEQAPTLVAIGITVAYCRCRDWRGNKTSRD